MQICSRNRKKGPAHTRRPLIASMRIVCADRSLLRSVLALLIVDTAGGLAGRLAGCLAFAAAAVQRALVQIACLHGLDSLHDGFPPFLETVLFESHE